MGAHATPARLADMHMDMVSFVRACCRRDVLRHAVGGLLRACACCVALAGLADRAEAASATWASATTGDWSTTGNWNGGVPGNTVTSGSTTSDTATFNSAGNYTVYLAATNRSISAVTISSGTLSLLGGTQAAAASQTLYLYGGLTVGPQAGPVTIGDAAGSTRDVSIRMGTANITNDSASLLTIADSLGSRGTGGTTTITFTGTGTGDTLVSGVIGASAGATVALTKSGSGRLILVASNTFAGATTINSGTLQVGNGGTTGNLQGSSSLMNNGVLVFNRSLDATQGSTFPHGISGSGALVQAGSAFLFLSGTNTYSGSTTVSAGVLQVSSSAALGTTDAGTTVASGARLSLSGGVTVTGESLSIEGAGLTSDYLGALYSASGINTWAGSITNNTSRIGGAAGATLRVTGVIGGSGDLTIRGGTTTFVTELSGANSYSGGTTLINATLRLAGGNDRLPTGGSLAFGASSVGISALHLAGISQEVAGLSQAGGTPASDVIGNSSTTSDATLTLNTAGANTFAGQLVDGVSGGTRKLNLTKLGSGTLTLSGSQNTFSGITSLQAGQVALGHSLALQNSTVDTWNGAAGSLSFGSLTAATLGGLTGSNGLVLTNTASQAVALSVGGNNGSTTFAGAISGVGSLAKSGSGTLALAGNSTFSGSTTISAGVLKVGAGGTTGLLSSSLLTVGSGALLAFNRTDQYGGSFASLITGSGGVRVDSGFLNLTAANTYSGATNVLAGGTLAVNGALGPGGLTVASGATLMGSGTIGGLTTIAGLHAPGNSPGVETFTNLTYDSGASVQWELWGNTTANSPLAYDQVVVGGDLTFSGTTTLNLAFTGSASAVAWSNAFWGTNQEWLLYDVAGTTTGMATNFVVATTNWQDSTGAFFQTARPDSSFTVEQRGSDIYVVYAVVPEPGALALAGIGLGAAAWAATGRRRWGSRRRCTIQDNPVRRSVGRPW